MTKDDSGEIKDLLSRISNGDGKSLESLHCLLADRLFGLTLGILKNRQDAEDSLQETFLKIWKNAGQYESDLGSPLGWVVTVTRNTAYDRYRKRVRHAGHMDNIQDDMNEQANTSQPQPADDRLLDVERNKKICEALVNLGGDQREAIELAFFSGHTQLEVSAKLGVPLGTIKARIRRGMQALKPYLTPLS